MKAKTQDPINKATLRVTNRNRTTICTNYEFLAIAKSIIHTAIKSEIFNFFNTGSSEVSVKVFFD